MINGQSVSANAGETLVDAALGGWIVIPHDCRSGQCETCRVTVVSGDVDPQGTADGRTVLACQATVAGDAEIRFEVMPETQKSTGIVAEISLLSPEVVEVVLGHPLRSGSDHREHRGVDRRGPGIEPFTRSDFTRTYNRASNKEPGILGVGWTTSFDGKIVVPSDGKIQLTKDNGGPIYYEQNGPAGRFTAASPKTVRSTIQNGAGGGFVRTFRDGGTETYSARGQVTGRTSSSAALKARLISRSWPKAAGLCERSRRHARQILPHWSSNRRPGWWRYWRMARPRSRSRPAMG